jgi:hypothetical protein
LEEVGATPPHQLVAPAAVALGLAEPFLLKMEEFSTLKVQYPSGAMA